MASIFLENFQNLLGFFIIVKLIFPTGRKLCLTTSFFYKLINSLLLAKNKCITPKEKISNRTPSKKTIYTTLVSLIIIQKQGEVWIDKIFLNDLIFNSINSTKKVYCENYKWYSKHLIKSTWVKIISGLIYIIQQVLVKCFLVFNL